MINYEHTKALHYKNGRFWDSSWYDPNNLAVILHKSKYLFYNLQNIVTRPCSTCTEWPYYGM